MVNIVDDLQPWHQLDPSLELVLLGTASDGSFSISVADQDVRDNHSSKAAAAAAAADGGGARFVSSDEESSSTSSESSSSSLNNHTASAAEDETKNSSTIFPHSSYSKSLFSHFPFNQDKENAPRKDNNKNTDDSSSSSSSKGRSLQVQSTTTTTFESFSCGFHESCDAISLDGATSSTTIEDDAEDNNDAEQDVSQYHPSSSSSRSITHMFGDTRFTDAFSCGSFHENLSHGSSSLLQSSAVVHYKPLLRSSVRASNPRLVGRGQPSNSLPEHHGPIRGQRISEDDDEDDPSSSSLSSSNSEAPTEHISNVSFAKLASTILTSQAAKKAVEPMDRIAALLESRGVGRGTHSIREIRESTDLRLFIDDYSEASFWPLLDSLYFNKCLTKLVLFRNRTGDRARVRTHREMDCFFRVLRHLSSTLSELHLWNLVTEDQPALSRGLAYYPSLEYIQLHLEVGVLSSSLVKALATLPNLTSLELEVSSSFRISELLNSKSLAILTVISCCSGSSSSDDDDDNPFEFETHEIVEFAKKLRNNRTLSVLHLEPRISADSSFPAILEALASKNRTLETFQFTSVPSTYQEGDMALQCALDTLRANSQLRVLWNNHYESWVLSARMRRKVFRALQKNKTLQQFHVFPEDADYWFKKTNILQKNMTGSGGGGSSRQE